MKKKKVAIVSDVMMSVGGAEVVTETLMEMFPEADFYTLFFTPGARKRFEKKFSKSKIYVSGWQKLVKSDGVTKYISIIKFFTWIYWENLNLDKYDLVISSSNSYMCKNIKRKNGARHVSYIHAPPRYLYNEFNQIGWIKKWPWNWLFFPVMSFLRLIDKRGSNRPDVILAASKFVADRIQKYYQRKSIVVYPPVETILVKKNDKKKYFICLSRLVSQKGIDLAVKVCTDNNWPLIVVGDGYEKQKLKKMAGKTVDFLGNKFGKEKFKLLAGAKALIYTSHQEDFGIVPIEALKLGTPVIAYNSGGVKETVINDYNGVLFNDFDKKSLTEAIIRFEKMNISSSGCKKSVKSFSSYFFKKEIKKHI